ncbi:hypothetical protein WICMUC_004137 [Wickerhamomyces mucosus]|uniref:Uncharacterized protein n=1 Tax=Wickerhamomyces mucosus TaxID=1378264 RepID=A0A9P8PIM4_9ASCO|nr:hypothetical protein WICMUC_004137 [Wickerhamomyces mucosus]
MNSETRHNKLTLHESISKKFEKTPDGSIFTKDLKTIFSLMIICLKLNEKPQAKPSKLSFLSRQSYPFSFTIQEALIAMSNLSLAIESSSTKTTISYSIKQELANSLLKRFMTAKLIHTPADRTRSEPKEKVLLQPTPKGVSIVQNYCETSGLRSNEAVNTLAPILNSTFNSMELFYFERSSITDTIIYSEYFIHLLFIRFLGPSPNVWRSTNPPDDLPSLEHRLEIDNEFDLSNGFTFEQYQAQIPHPAVNVQTEEKSFKRSIMKSKQSKRESPFAHNFFTNPESDSHIQYYVSNKGVRLYEDSKFGDLVIKYCFNAKAGWQWLMDCSDIMNPKQASTILNLFFKNGLIEPIILYPSTVGSKITYPPLKTSFYTLIKKGWGISRWSSNSKGITIAEGEEITIPSLPNLTLSNQAVSDSLSNSEEDENPIIEQLREEGGLNIKNVLNDPGMRYLFRNHLEKEYCAENLDVFIDIKHFNKKMSLLKNLNAALSKSNKIENENRIKVPMVKLINECLSSAYNIYSSYITIGSPYQLNIDHLLREKITYTMVDTSSPLRSHFRDSNEKIIEKTYAKNQPPYRDDKDDLLATEFEDAKSLESIFSRTSLQDKISSKNTKHLSIDIPQVNSIKNSSETPKTPTIEDVFSSLNLLFKLLPLFDILGKQILKMLEFDSFPKFIKSESFNNAFSNKI